MTEFVYHTPEKPKAQKALDKIREIARPRLLAGGAIVLLLVAIPLSIAAVQHKKNEIRTKAAPASGPTFERVEVVPFGANSSFTGNGWGPNLSRIVRMSNGDIYTTLLGNPHDSTQTHKEWRLAKRTAATGQWEVYSPPGATMTDVFHVPEVIRGPNDSFYIISWVNLLPRIWSSTTNTETAVPGNWYVNDRVATGYLESDYPGTAINANGDILTSQIAAGCNTCSTPSLNTKFNYVFKPAGSTAWTFNSVTQAIRHAYSYINLRQDQSFSSFGTADFKPVELGFPSYPDWATGACPGCSYAFEGIMGWLFQNATASTPTQVKIFDPEDPSRCLGNNSGSPTNVLARDGYEDANGRIHILYSMHSSQNNCAYEGYHAIVQNGQIVKNVKVGIPYENYGRIIQDTKGRYYFFSVLTHANYGNQCVMYLQSGLDGDTDGTQLSGVQIIPLNVANDCSNLQNHFIASPRHGTTLADYVDGVLATDHGYRSLYYRLRLAPVTATDVPTPSLTAPATTMPSPSVAPRTGKVNIYPATATHSVGETFPILVTVTADENFSAAQASISVSPNLSVLSVSQPDPQYGPCNFTTYTQSPTASNPSFAASYGPGYAANSCTVYSMNVQAVASGPATVTVNNNVVRSRATDADIGGGATNGAFTIQAGTGSIPATATILTSGASSNYLVGDTFTVDVRVNGGGNSFNAAQATVITSSNLSVLGVGIVPASSGGCNFSYTVSPTIANPSFAGAILGGSSSACTVYTLTLRAVASGTGSIQFSSASVKFAVNSSEILSGVTNGSMTIGVPATPSPTPTPTPNTTATPTPTGSAQPSPTAIVAPTASPVPTATVIPTATPATTCPAAFGKQADINNDGKVDITDLFQLANDWRKSTVQLLYSRSDINCDGIVDLTDLSILARLFGT